MTGFKCNIYYMTIYLETHAGKCCVCFCISIICCQPRKLFYFIFSSREDKKTAKTQNRCRRKLITYNPSLIASVIGQTYSLDKYCYRNSYVEYPAYLKRLNSISNSTTLKFENLCWILQLKLYLQGTTMGYRISKRI